MSRLKHIGVYMVWLFIAFVCWCICISNAEKIQQFSKTVDLVYPIEQFSSGQIENIIEKESKLENPIMLTAWSQYNQQQIYNDNKKTITADIINVSGNIEDIFKVPMLLGKNPTIDDKESCAIDKQTAFELWGGIDVIGFELEWNEITYIVRGIFDYSQKVVIVHPQQKSEEKVFRLIRINLPEQENTYEQAQNFIIKYELNQPIIKDISPLAIIFSQLASIPCIIISIFILCHLYNIIKNKHDTLKGCIICIVISLIVIVLLVWIIPFNIKIPSVYIPTRWSDFEFWTRTFDNLKMDFQQFQTMELLHTDLIQSKIYKTLLISFIGTLIAFVFASIKLKQKHLNLTDIFYYQFTSIIVIFLAIIIIGGIDTNIVNYKTLWGIWLIYIGIFYLSKQIKK